MFVQKTTMTKRLNENKLTIRVLSFPSCMSQVCLLNIQNTTVYYWIPLFVKQMWCLSRDFDPMSSSFTFCLVSNFVIVFCLIVCFLKYTDLLETQFWQFRCPVWTKLGKLNTHSSSSQALTMCTESE